MSWNNVNQLIKQNPKQKKVICKNYFSYGENKWYFYFQNPTTAHYLVRNVYVWPLKYFDIRIITHFTCKVHLMNGSWEV